MLTDFFISIILLALALGVIVGLCLVAPFCFSLNEDIQKRYQEKYLTGTPAMGHVVLAIFLWELVAFVYIFFVALFGWSGWLASALLIGAPVVALFNTFSCASDEARYAKQRRQTAQQQRLAQDRYQQELMVQQTIASIDRLGAAYLDGARRASRALRTKGR